VLVLVGAMMMGESTQIEWRNMLVAVPAFLTIVIQPFTFSIANGIYAGLIMSALVYLLTGAFIDAGRDMLATLSGDAGPGDGERAAVDVLDNVEAAMASGRGPKADGEGIEAPLLGGAGGDDAAGQGGTPVASDAISISQRARAVRDGIVGSVSRSHPYERGSFSMYINTAGSHTTPSHLAGFHLGSPAGQAEPGMNTSMSGGVLSSAEEHH
jgi:hypothetical protein